MDKYYLRIEDNSFGFLAKDVNVIKESDIAIEESDYKLFFELQSKGKQFRLKEVPTGTGLFDYVEEYIPEVIEDPKKPGAEDYLLSLEYRISKIELELGVE